MFHPTGQLPNGKTLICMMDEEEELDNIIDECESSEKYVKAVTEWLNENDYCVESWQLKEYLKAKGMDEDKMNEDMGAAAPAAPAPGLATLGNVSGMGNPSPPSSAGATNSGFYNPANNGSGDKFTSLTAGTGAAKNKKAKTVDNYLEFVKKRKKK
jgi:hypothetical protein